MTERETIMVKIKKLLALATSDNENEAAMAAAKAQDMLFEHNISRADLESVSTTNDEKIVRVRVAPAGHNIKNWLVSLSDTIAAANLCKILTSGASTIWIGKPSNIEVAQFLTDTVARDLERICDKNWTIFNWFQREAKQDWEWVHGKTWKNNFYYGAIEVIREKLSVNLKRLEENTNMLALVVQNNAEMDEFMERTYPKLGSRNMGSTAYNSDARNAGRAAGQSISFGKGIGAGGNNGPRLLGKG